MKHKIVIEFETETPNSEQLDLIKKVADDAFVQIEYLTEDEYSPIDYKDAKVTYSNDFQKNRIPALHWDMGKPLVKQWFEEMNVLDLLFHPEDSPESIGIFTDEECKDVNAIMEEINKHEKDPCAIALEVGSREYAMAMEKAECHATLPCVNCGTVTAHDYCNDIHGNPTDYAPSFKDFRGMYPVAETEKICKCTMQTIMSVGCQCGGK